MSIKLYRVKGFERHIYYEHLRWVLSMEMLSYTRNMPNKSELNSTRISHVKIALIIGGLIVTVGWVLTAASLNLAAVLPCNISPNACYEGRSVADMILLLPILIGNTLLTFGIVSSIRLRSMLIKLFIGVGIMIVVTWMAWYSMILAHILFHGL